AMTSRSCLTGMLALCLVVVGLVPSIASAQEQAPVRLYVLERIIFGPTKAPLPDGYRPPSESIADLDGGVIEFTIDYAADRVETQRFTWSFDRDIYTLKIGDTFNVELEGRLVGPDTDQRRASGSFSGGYGRFTPEMPGTEMTGVYRDSFFGANTRGNISVYSEPNKSRPGTDSMFARGEMSVWENARESAERIYFQASAGGKAYGDRFGTSFFAVYVYRPIRGDDPVPPRSEVIVEAPRPDRDPDTIGIDNGSDPSAPTAGNSDATDPIVKSDPAAVGGGIRGGTEVSGPSSPSAAGEVGAADERAGRRVIAPTLTAETGQTVVVPIRLANPDGVANLNVDIRYDADVLTLAGSVRPGALTRDVLFRANGNAAGLVRIGFAGLAELSQDGVIAELVFDVVGDAGSSSDIAVSVSVVEDLDGQSLPTEAVSGGVDVVGRGFLRGDCNGDGVVDLADAACALEMSVGLLPADQQSDVDGDGAITSSDSREILRKTQSGR
ncbi:MAG: cohesin domain-containing protein, partial [Planctomycetota bacterium]